MKIIIANTNIQALLQATEGVLDKYGRGDVPENIKGQATLSALKSLFQQKFFSICDMGAIAKMNEVHIPQEMQQFFQTLHCVHFADMTPEVREYLFASCVDLFRGNISMANLRDYVQDDTE